MAFYDGEEAAKPEFVERLLGYKADCAMWFLPEANVHETILGLNDNGVGAISIGGEFYAPVPPHYRLNRSRAALRALAEWHREKIACVAAVYYGSRALALPADKVETLLRESAPERGYKGKGTEALIKYLEEVSNLDDAGIAFASPDFAQFVCYRAPEQLFALMRKKRVMLPHGPLTVQFGEVPDVAVDLIAFDWQQVAEKIKTDLDEEKLPEAGKPHLLYGKWQPRVSLRRA